MKKAMAILLAAVLALACTACGGSKNGETKDRLAQIKEKGYIELCTEPYFAPYEYVDPNKSVPKRATPVIRFVLFVTK